MNWQTVTNKEKPIPQKWYLVKMKFNSGRISTFPSMKPKFPFIVGKEMYWDENHKVQENEEYAFLKEPSKLLSSLYNGA